jgi:hypothetical protein
MDTSYSPVDPYFYEIIEKERSAREISLVHYFDSANKLEDARGKIDTVIASEKNEMLLLLESGESIRLDRIITINGKPGPAYDEYDSYANACLDCRGEPDQSDQD